jgi:predicted metal-dependent hydrolase
MSYPIAARDALYTLFRAFLNHPEAKHEFSHKDLEPLRLRHPAYVADRVPRYVKVLHWWKEHKKDGGLEDHVRLGEALFNAGLFFDSHEYLEGVWRQKEGEDKIFLQGLIQVAAAMHKLELDPAAFEGALYLMDHGMKKVEESPRYKGNSARLASLVEIRNRIVAERIDLSDLPKLHIL